VIPSGASQPAPERETGEGGGNSRSLPARFMLVLATGCGLGYAPFAPGTFGSLAGLPLAWGLHHLPAWGQFAAAVLCFVVGIPICGIGARQLGMKDPGAVVFDEIASFAVVFLWTPFNLLTAALGFALFRVFDVLKPWPASRLERLPGGLGIMADDCAAALYAAAGLWLIDRWYPLG